MDPIDLTLRVGRLPAASTPVGGELSAEQVDGNFTALRTAAEQLNDEKAPHIGATAPEPAVRPLWITEDRRLHAHDGDEWFGVAGVGVPTGGTAGQVLTKIDSEDYSTEWTAPASGGVDPVEFDALRDEVIDARGDRSALGLRISNVSNFASPNVGGVIVGRYYDNAFHGLAAATLASSAGRIQLAPYFTSQRLRIDQIGVAVSTASAGAARCVIYESTTDGWPDALVLSVDILDTSATGYRFGDVDFTFDAGRQYWLGVHTEAAPTLRTVALGSSVNIGLLTADGTAYNTSIRRSISYASGPPTTWGFLETDLLANATPPSIRMRAAAL